MCKGVKMDKRKHADQNFMDLEEEEANLERPFYYSVSIYCQL
jgi:hypothetical protein